MYEVRRHWERYRVPFYPVGESLTEQSHKHSCDINNIVQRHQRTGGIPPPQRPPLYQDVTRLQADLRERMEFAAETLGKLESALSALPSPPEAGASSGEAVTPGNTSPS